MARPHHPPHLSATFLAPEIDILVRSRTIEPHPMRFSGATNRNTIGESTHRHAPPPVHDATKRTSRIDLAQLCASLPSPQRINPQNRVTAIGVK